MKPLIQLTNLFKVYGTGETEVRALIDINLQIKAGEYCAIMGTSGSGKSTLMNMIGCLDRPTSGRYELDGTDIANLSDVELAHIRNLKIGFVFQQFHLIPQLSALENVMLPMVYANVHTNLRRERAIFALQQVGLGKRIHARPNQLSGGQQQRVAIARAIVTQPNLLLADEPTGALDSHTTQEIITIFNQLNQQGITIILVTHESEVANNAHRTILCHDGRISASLFPID
jgi:putative ABC transport system ATP-binding protein